MPVECPTSLLAFFPPKVYRNVGACDVLPLIVEQLDRETLSTIQFLRNGAVRLTFMDVPSCDAVLLNGFDINGHRIRVAAVEQRSRLVYLRDLPCEVPDDAVRAALRPFGEIHSLQKSSHNGFPGLFDGSRVVKMSLAKDIPPVVCVAGFECHIWYRRQPQWCPFCRAPGHRAKDCPMNGKCRRCRQPGHVARDCRSAWGGPAPRPTRTRAAACEAPAAVPAVAPPADVGAEGASSGPPGAAPVVEVSEAEVSESTSADEEMCSGDEEVLANASAAVIGSLSAPRRPRASKCRRRKKITVVPEAPASVSSVPFAYVAPTCFDVVHMDTVEEEVPRRISCRGKGLPLAAMSYG